MRCEQIMKRNIECLREHDTIATAARNMRNNEVGFLPVCDEAGRVHGTITDRDLAIRIRAADRLMSTSVVEVMTQAVIACSPADEVSRVEELMGQLHESHMLVCDEKGKLLGVISLSDIAQYDQAGAATLHESVPRLVRP